MANPVSLTNYITTAKQVTTVIYVSVESKVVKGMVTANYHPVPSYWFPPDILGDEVSDVPGTSSGILGSGSPLDL